jgi:IclR family pca regulon transcriptional regulator
MTMRHEDLRSPAKAEPTTGKDATAETADQQVGDRDFMTSLARGLSVMQAMARQKRPSTVSEISVHTDISRAAVRRCLYTLVKLGFVASQDQRQFFLCPKVLTLGQAIPSTSLSVIAQPVLERLSHVVSESCSVATLSESDVLYIARAAVSRIMSVDLKVGSRLPAYCTSMGRVLLAHLSSEQLDRYLSGIVPKAHTARTIVSVSKLRRVIDQTKRRGYAITDQELEIALRSIAVPIYDSRGDVIAAMNVGCHAQRASPGELRTTVLPYLREAALEISKMM